MKRTPIRKVSARQQEELKQRRLLKAQLVLECGGVCPKCNGEHQDFRGLCLVHKIPLSKGGKTNRENCVAWCYYDHNKFYHGIKEVDSKPHWSEK